MLRHVFALAVGLQGARMFFDLRSLCVNMYRKNSAYIIEIIVMKIKYHSSYNVVRIKYCYS